MSGELSSEIFRTRVPHFLWELQRPEHITKGDILSWRNIALFNRHFDSQHFSVSNQYLPRGMDLDKISPSIFGVLSKKEAK